MSAGPPKPMLCHEAPKGSDGMPVLPAGDQWRMEVKRDGWRFLWHVTGGDTRSYGGRNGSDHSGKALDIESRLAAALPADTIVDGELITTEDGLAVSTALARYPTNLRAVLFDIIRVGGYDVRGRPWRERRAFLEAVGENLDLTPAGPVTITDVHPVDQALYESWLEVGAEGAVVKHIASKYHSGRRSREWLKLKPKSTAEAIVRGYELGKGASNRDVIGAFEIQLLDTPSVFTSVAAKAGHQQGDPERFLGHVLEFQHYGFGAGGGPRHPTFLRWRPDRD